MLWLPLLVGMIQMVLMAQNTPSLGATTYMLIKIAWLKMFQLGMNPTGVLTSISIFLIVTVTNRLSMWKQLL